ncbi:DUF416 family protein [Carnimonas bestiolae]|uniref:DUF416 family protein n=1 Tax=Carnimonas bestiolae TaxID=3402172 RepID=UPI003EDC0825
MHENQFDALEAAFESLDERGSVAAAATLCERMLHNYRLYCEMSGGGHRRQADSSMALVWEKLLAPAAKINFELQAEKLLPLETELEKSLEDGDSSFGAQMARDAIMALGICLEAAVGKRPGAVVELSRLSRGEVDQMAALRGEQSEDAEALRQDEQEFQSEIIELLSEQGAVKQTVQALKRLGNNDGVSNLGLALED